MSWNTSTRSRIAASVVALSLGQPLLPLDELDAADQTPKYGDRVVKPGTPAPPWT